MTIRKDVDLYAIVNSAEFMDDPDYTQLEVVCKAHIEAGLWEYGKRKHQAEPYMELASDDENPPFCFVCVDNEQEYVRLSDMEGKEEIEKAFGIVLV